MTGRWHGSQADRFWARVDRSGGLDACWPWTGATRKGYGIANEPAHRRAYKLAVGPIPAGLTLDHLCRNKVCVNPAHLEPVTRAENAHRERGYRWRALCRVGHDMPPYVPGADRECHVCRRHRHTAYMRGYNARRRAERTAA